MSAQLEVVPFSQCPPLTDIAGMLRAIADQIESGTFGVVPQAVLLLDQIEGPPTVHGIGQSSAEGALRILACGTAEMVRILSNPQTMERI